MDSIFSASEPALGYLYQIKYGLMLIISKQNPDTKLLIEQLDDISIQTATSLDVYQTKYHIKSVANLTDASTDLWKTIRVWSEGIANGQFDPENCLFNLITTASTKDNTIPHKLKYETLGSRDCKNIIGLLNEVIKKSESSSNKSSYMAFTNLSEEQQVLLVNNIAIIDASVDINGVTERIKKSLCYSVAPEKIEALLNRLEGWFLGEIISQLLKNRSEITGREVQDKILDISDSLKVDNLPADFTTSIASDENQLSPYRHHKFVKQLEAIGINNKLINHAISDYHRAFSQKSKWLREGLITPLDEISYDNKLFDDWDRKFAIVQDSEGKGEEIEKSEGKNFYQNYYVNIFPDIHIKERFKEQYMVTGSCQILSDKKKIGWHPNFKNLIS